MMNLIQRGRGWWQSHFFCVPKRPETGGSASELKAHEQVVHGEAMILVSSGREKLAVARGRAALRAQIHEGSRPRPRSDTFFLSQATR